MKNLKVIESKYKSDLTFNEWAKELKVSSGYIKPTEFFQGHRSCKKKTLIERIFNSILNFFIR
jgi:hypothetical protein